MGKGKKIIEERPSALVQISVGYQINIVFGKGPSSKPSGKHIVAPNLCFLR